MAREILKLLNDERNIKVLINIDDDGLAYPAVKDSLRNEDEDIVYTEFLESSNTNRFLTKALWFDKKVSILLLTYDKRSFKIVAQPIKAIVSGKVFQKYYEEVQEKFKDLDLSTVWVFKPLEITEQTLRKRVDEETRARPYFLHLDRLAKGA
jgi:monomeric isocitrate dehydrogenase